MKVQYDEKACSTGNDHQKDIAVIRHRLIKDYLNNGKWSAAVNFLKTQDSNGKWSNIDYESTSSNKWLPLTHLSNLYEMVIAYRHPSSEFYHSAAMLEGIRKGLSFWYQKKPKSVNWWFNEIGQQVRLGPILLILQYELPEEIVSTGTGYLYDPTQISTPGVKTGQNLVWFAGETIHRGLINYNGKDIQQGLDYIKNEIKVSTGEGIQPDFSFHQHGPMLYNGGYGFKFMIDCSFWVSVVHNTKYAFEKEKIDILSGLLLEGDRWMARGKSLDFSVQGREITRKENRDKAYHLIGVCDILKTVNPAKAEEIEELKNSISGMGKPHTILGNKFFWRSDYMTHHREKFFVSVKMSSARTIGIEMINFENLKGYWLPFGLTNIQQRGTEYKDIFPVWDWARLPGVTSPYKVGVSMTTVSQEEKFVGGVSDGQYGVSAMTVNKMATVAKKSWFFFDDEFVALGAGITSQDENPVGTTLNQCLKNGNVLVDGDIIPEGETSFVNAKWVLHDGIGYILPSGLQVKLKTGLQSGSWKAVNDIYAEESITKNVFTLWLDHGIHPVDATYQYIVLPGTDADSLTSYTAAQPVRVMVNNCDLQAVRHDKSGITGIVFYRPGTISIRDGFELKVDKPCILLVREEGGKLTITASNPMAEAEKLIVSVKSFQKSREISFDLPGGGMAGSSISKSLE